MATQERPHTGPKIIPARRTNIFWSTMGTGPMGMIINAPMAINATNKEEYTVILS
jgi:hypothetical protein